MFWLICISKQTKKERRKARVTVPLNDRNRNRNRNIFITTRHIGLDNGLLGDNIDNING